MRALLSSLPIFALVPVVLCAACQSGGNRKPDRRPEQQKKYDKAIEQGIVSYGMTKSEVEQAVGKPQRKDRTRMGDKTVDRWIYAYSEVYFDDDGFVIRLYTAG